MTLAFTKHEPINSLYYYKGQLAQSDKEKAEQAIGPPKAVVATNTRLPADADAMGVGADELAAELAGRLGSALPSPSAMAGVDRLSTPSFTPGEGGFSPLMTWGELGSTPLRLDGTGPEDFEIVLPPGAGTGPFQVQALGAREAALHKLAHSKAGAGLRRPSPALALLQQHKQGQGRARTPLLSPAARALASRLKGGAGTPLVGSERDEGLRASYCKTAASTPLLPGGGSGSRPASRASTPLQVPRSAAAGVSSKASVATSTTGRSADALLPAQGESITDDLLKL